MLVMGIYKYIVGSMSLLGFVALAFSKDCTEVTCPKCNRSQSLDMKCLDLCKGSDSNQCISGANMICIKVWLNHSSNEINEGGNFSASCEHNLTKDDIIKFVWIMDNKPLPCKNTTTVTLQDRSSASCQSASQLVRKDILKKFKIFCEIHSYCGNFTSNTVDISVKDNSILVLVICAVIAVVILLAFTLGMKLLLKRDIAQRKTRTRQQAQNLSNVHTTTTDASG